MTKHRHTASTITDDTLDRLYDNASRGWRRGDRWKRRAEEAEAATARAREIVRRLAAHAVGFQDVLDDSDRDPWAKTVGADIVALQDALSVTPCTTKDSLDEENSAP